jgi:predicted DNA-binding transcriptional regulator AlpA
MSTTSVLFIDDICRELGTSRRTVQRLRRHRAFPIPELPALDKRPRWSRAAVDAYLASAERHEPTLRGARGIRACKSVAGVSR